MRTSLMALCRRVVAGLFLGLLALPAAALITPVVNLSGLPSSTVPTRNLNLTATLSGSSGTPTGSVDFTQHNLSSNGRTGLCGNITVDPSGNASCFFTTPPNGNYEIEVVYSGDGVYAATTTAFPFTTAQATVTITLSGLLSTVPGRNLTLTSNVSSASPLGTPTGSVDFVRHDLSSNGRTGLCGNINVDPSGNSSCFFTTPPNGNYEIEVNYSGDGPNAPGTRAFPFTTQQATVSITLSGLPSSTMPLTSLTLTSNVSSASPLGTPTGSVDFVRHDLSSNGRTGLCGNINVDPSGNSSCFFTTPSVLGSYEIEVNYSGDAANAAGTGVFPFTVSNSPVVTTVADSGPGSLRDAITFVNNNCAGQTITFNIAEPAGIKTIHLLSGLPRLTCNSMTIDGYSQPGSSRNTATTGNNAVILIEIDGTNTGVFAVNGIEIGNASSNIAGIAIGGFRNGSGIAVFSPINTLGVQLSGVFIGTDATGTIARPNVNGVHTTPRSTGLGVCDGNPGGRNLVSGNFSSGIRLESGDFTFVCNTYIGTNASGNAALANGGMGIEANGTTRTQILGNVISGNGSDGIYIGPSQPGVVITGNLIGTGADGTTSLGNANMGVTINTDGVTAGGDPVSAGNVIANNRFDGVNVASGNNNAIEGNSIYGNGRLGISLTLNGSVLPNDSCDADGGSNGRANYPVLASVTSGGGTTTITGTHNSTASTTFRLEFFSNFATDSAANRAGRIPIGIASVATDGTCNAAFTVSLPVTLAAGDLVTATSTDPSGNTSEFSNAVAVAGIPLPTISAIRPASGSLAGGSAVVIEGSNFDVSTTVTIGGNPATVNFYGSTSLTVTAPAYGTTGAVAVAVTNAYGTTTVASGFNYVSDDSAARDFSVAANPSPRWSYGYEPAAYGAFTPFSSHFRSGSGDIWWLGPEPTVLHNFSGSTYTPACCNPIPPGGLLMHPGAGGEKSVIRWTAPSSGGYHVAGAFTGLDGAGTTTDVAVLKNNNAAAPLFSANVFDTGVPHAFALDIAMNAGDTLEFTVGFGNGNYASDSTGLDATIAQTVAAPTINLTPPSLSFAARTVGTTSAAQTVTLTNNGPGKLTLSTITVTGDFSFATTCPLSVAAGATCDINVTFTPITTGTRTGTLTVASNASGSPHAVALTGSGLAASVGVFDVSPPSVDFAAQPVGFDSPPELVRVANTGPAPVTFTAPAVVGDFAVLGGAAAEAATGNQSCGATLAPAESCYFALVFHPGSAATLEGTLWVQGDASNSPVLVQLVGTGVSGPPARALTVPPQLVFADQPVGTTSPGLPLAISNDSIVTASITELTVSGADFAVSDTCTTIAPHATCSPVVFFQPTAVGARIGSVTIRSLSESDPYVVALAGNGLFSSTPAIAMSLTRFGFGDVLLGGAASTVLEIVNIGLVPVSLGPITAGGDFFVTHDCGATIPVAARCTVRVGFMPRTRGSAHALLEISSNASGAPHRVDLSGIGCSIPNFARARLQPVLCAP